MLRATVTVSTETAIVDMDTSEVAADDLSLATRVNQEWNKLSKTERIVARFLVAAPPQQIMLATAGDIGQKTSTSDATVVRTARRLGYAGLPDLKSAIGAHLGTIGPPQISSRLHLSQTSKDLSAAASSVVSDALHRVTEFGRNVDVTQLGKALQLIASASEVFCYGWGTNELSARYLALKLNRIGKPSRASGATGFTLADDLLAISSRSAVVVFAPGRVLPDLRLLVDQAKATGAGLILVTEQMGEEITGKADAVLQDRGPSGGLTAEPLCAMLLADMLVLATMAVSKDSAVNSYELLTRLRKEIVGDA
jgi:DNA-binding MurR/RpiR family transcriptional regulator